MCETCLEEGYRKDFSVLFPAHNCIFFVDVSGEGRGEREGSCGILNGYKDRRMLANVGETNFFLFFFGGGGGMGTSLLVNCYNQIGA